MAKDNSSATGTTWYDWLGNVVGLYAQSRERDAQRRQQLELARLNRPQIVATPPPPGVATATAAPAGGAPALPWLRDQLDGGIPWKPIALVVAALVGVGLAKRTGVI